MKYTTIKFHHSTYLPGFGQTSELQGVEATVHEHCFLAIKGPTGVVTVPWSAVSYAFEEETVHKFSFAAPPAGDTVKFVKEQEFVIPLPTLDGGSLTVTAVSKEPGRETVTLDAAPKMQPPPPQKKGGKR